MASETENTQCPACGAAVRPGASFCFKCGKHFEAAEENPPVSTAGEAVSGGEREFEDTIPDSDEEVVVVGTGYPLPAEDDNEAEIKPFSVRAKPQLTSAAALRRKPKLQREKIEMVWEQPAENSNPIFVIGTIVIFILVLLIILFVYLLK